MLPNDKSLQSEKYLGQVDIHSQWQSDYLNADLDRFYDLAFADMVNVLKARPSDKILDAGCGYCYHTTRLARSGASITAVDFSDAALVAGQQTIARAGIADRVNLQQADLTKLPFSDNSFDFVVSWGVLMHVPELEMALAELSRVLKPAGVLVLCENNVGSLDVTIRERAVNAIKRLVGRTVPEMRETPSGTEAWIKREEGGLMVRKTKISFISEFLKAKGLVEFRRSAGQFTELYTNLPSKALKRLVYALNMFYYKHVGLPSLAMGNIIYYRKT
jgi:ubiquinone/menaquinone biosynthesis C-methylase UbiE